jgi:signal transduction histidine kinase
MLNHGVQMTNVDKPSLLIVDDEQGPAESLRMIFKPSYNVYMASGGRQALDIIHAAPIDVVTLDLRMPEMSGMEVLEHIKAFDPDIEVIVVTGYSSLDSALRGLRFGVFDYVSKPFDVPQISDLVRRAVARRRETMRSRRVKEDFLSNLSHELRTPLNAILGYTSILVEELQTTLTAEQQTALQRLQVNSHDLFNLVESVLLLNSIEAGELALNPQPFDLRETIERSVDRFRLRAAEKGLALTCALPPHPLIVTSDEEKIERVLWVLLENAVKFTMSGSVSVRAVHTAQGAQIEVRDTGIGMAPEERLSALQGLSQADSSPRRRFRGLGVGLRVAMRLLQLLGGSLQATSETAHGTRFIVTIPDSPRPQPPRLHS